MVQPRENDFTEELIKKAHDRGINPQNFATKNQLKDAIRLFDKEHPENTRRRSRPTQAVDK